MGITRTLMMLMHVISSRVARSQRFWSQIVISVVKKTMTTKGKYKEKQRALLKVWLQKCRNLATLISRAIYRVYTKKIRKQLKIIYCSYFNSFALRPVLYVVFQSRRMQFKQQLMDWDISIYCLNCIQIVKPIVLFALGFYLFALLLDNLTAISCITVKTLQTVVVTQLVVWYICGEKNKLNSKILKVF